MKNSPKDKSAHASKYGLPPEIDQWTVKECIYHGTVLRTFFRWRPAATVLAYLAFHDDVDVQRVGIDGLGHIGGEFARAQLLRLLEKTKGSEVDELVINSMNFPYIRRASDIDLLNRVLRDPAFTSDAKVNALRSLEQLINFECVSRVKARAGLPFWATFLESPDVLTRKAAEELVACASALTDAVKI